jgi:xanthine dehydrogenase accessory factor
MIAPIAPGLEPVPQVPRAAFLSDDASEVLHFALQSLDGGYGAALVTLVEIRGGAARSIGAQMAVRDDGLYCGFVSGGCTEAAVAAEAVIALQEGTDRSLRLGEGSPFFDIVLPCGGGITLAIHVIRNASVLRKALAFLQRRIPVCLRYHARAQTLAFEPGEGLAGWKGDFFMRAYRPRQRLIAGGTPMETGAVARVAAASGYEVLVVERGCSLSADQLDRDTAVAILYHDIDKELPFLACALASPAFYIGALGSRRTHAKRCAVLRQLGYGECDLARIKAPIGIFDKARDTNSLALSILADVAQSRLQEH